MAQTLRNLRDRPVIGPHTINRSPHRPEKIGAFSCFKIKYPMQLQTRTRKRGQLFYS